MREKWPKMMSKLPHLGVEHLRLEQRRELERQLAHEGPGKDGNRAKKKGKKGEKKEKEDGASGTKTSDCKHRISVRHPRAQVP